MVRKNQGDGKRERGGIEKIWCSYWLVQGCLCIVGQESDPYNIMQFELITHTGGALVLYGN